MYTHKKTFGSEIVYADKFIENRWGLGEKEEFLTLFHCCGLNYLFLQQRKYYVVRKASFTATSDKTET